MPQAKVNTNTRAVDSLSDSNPKSLVKGQRIVQNDDGVWLNTTTKGPRGERTSSRRIDSKGDMDHVAKGGEVWWKKLLDEQTASDEAAEAKATAIAEEAATKAATKANKPAGKGGK